MGLAPDQFWRMSLAEWRAALAGRFAPLARAEPLDRAALALLIRRYPDA